MNFYKRMEIVCKEIPRGQVATYGQIALLCQKPNNARQVGNGLKRGRAGEVPAHRVVNRNGILSGASSFAQPDLQKCLLEREKVEVLWSEKGYKVNLKKYGWHNTLEEAETFIRIFENEGI